MKKLGEEKVNPLQWAAGVKVVVKGFAVMVGELAGRDELIIVVEFRAMDRQRCCPEEQNMFHPKNTMRTPP
jgi:hypothetical protein